MTAFTSIAVPGGSSESWLGKDLMTPTKPEHSGTTSPLGWPTAMLIDALRCLYCVITLRGSPTKSRPEGEEGSRGVVSITEILS